MLNWYLKTIISQGLEYPGNSQDMLSKMFNNSKRWTIDEIGDEDKRKIYDYTKRSYEKGDTKQVFDERTFWNKVRNGPWIFYGDKNMTGYVTVREMHEIPGMLKLTGMAGGMKGVIAGMALLLKGNKLLIGAVTSQVYDMAIRGGFNTLPGEDIKVFINHAPSGVWGYGGKPARSPAGDLQVNMPELNKTIDKKFICNEAFINWLNTNYKSKGNG